MGSKTSWTEYFRFLTPVMLTIALYILGNIDAKVNKIDDKLFRHLTNDELHAPRSIVITKPEFEIYQQMRNKQMDGVERALCDIRDLLRDHVGRVK